MSDRVALIIGGTGMLRQCTEAIAAKAATSVLVARSTDKLNEIAAVHSNVRPFSANYTDEDFVSRLLHFLTKYNIKPNLCVLWMHKSGLDNKQRLLVELAAMGSEDVEVYEVCSSAASQPGQKSPTFSATSINHHVIILGFKIENGTSRWLTDEEISGGVLEAIDKQTNIAIVGQIEPMESETVDDDRSTCVYFHKILQQFDTNKTIQGTSVFIALVLSSWWRFFVFVSPSAWLSWLDSSRSFVVVSQLSAGEAMF